MMQESQKIALLKSNKANQLINYVMQSHWIIFCLIIFAISRLILFQQLMWVNAFTHLDLSPLYWLSHWDSFWYNDIVTNGYSTSLNYAHHANYVFFPLLPLLTLILKSISGLPVLAAGQIICNLFFLGSLLLFYRYIKFLTDDEISARFGIVLISFSPFIIYFASFYTESLFLFFSLAAMLSAYQKRWWLAGLMGMLLTLLRPNGVMIFLPLLFMAINQYHHQHITLKSFLPLCLIPLGLISYMLYLHYKIGDAIGFIHNELYWGRPGIDITLSNTQFIHIILTEFFYNVVFSVLAIFLIFNLYQKRFFNEFLYFMTTLIPAIYSGNPMSMARYSACTFTFYLALIFLSYRKKYLMLALLLIEALYFGLYVSAWINNSIDAFI